MSCGEFEHRPAKKRRFFVEEEPAVDAALAHEPSQPAEANASPESPVAVDPNNQASAQHAGSRAFDADLFASFVGEQVSPETLKGLQEASGSNIERAINLYLDGTWKSAPQSAQQRSNGTLHSFAQPARPPIATIEDTLPDAPAPTIAQQPQPKAAMPNMRYIGAFGVAGWATRTGSGLIRFGEKVNIERARTQPTTKLGRGGKRIPNKRQDIVVRFTNARGDEVGRLENESAAWISSLIDQGVCAFEGSCVYTPDRLRTNDTVYLQLRVYLLKKVFEAGGFVKPADTNRESTLFEAKETSEERNLRLRQVAMVKLFDEINLHPTRANSQAEKHRRQGLLKAAELAEKSEQQGTPSLKPQSSSGNEPGTPPSDEVEEGKELEQDQLDSLYKKAQSFDFDTPEAEPAKTFAMDLRKYQRQALHWMISKEKDEKSDHKEMSMHPLWEEYTWPAKDVDDNPLPEVPGQPAFYVNPYSGELSLDFPMQEQNCLGGILADEMGLGKTIEMLSLIHSHTPDHSPNTNSSSRTINDLPRLPLHSSSVEQAPHTTLVVAPMSLLAQWQSEAEKASKSGTLNVMVYYGSEKTVNLQRLCCEANAASAPNVIITSYGTVLSEFNQVAGMEGNRGSHGGLFSVEYFRVILDEAHYIKNRQSKTAKACYELSARHRWVLTGTPIVNRLEDLFSLVHFLRVEPWSNFSFWKTFITVPFESGDFIRALDVVQTVLEPLVMRRTKDMKTPNGEALVPLPPRKIEVESIELSKAEKEVYDWIYTRAKRTFAANVEAGTLMKSYTTIFAQILRLRQSCCHPLLTRSRSIVAEEEDAAVAADLANGFADDMDLDTLIQQFEAEDENGEQDVNKFGAHVLKQIQAEQHSECPICAEEPMEEQAVTGCWHSACKQCLLDFIEHQRDKGEIPRCFNCREPINSRDVFVVVRHDAYNDDEALYSSPGNTGNRTPRISLRRVSCAASAKVESLVTQLKKIRREEPGTKSVVFSQFTSFLDLIEPALARDNIPFVRFDGTMSQKARATVLQEFTNRPKGVVLLLSLRAGGVGLNLTAARRVFMMDPWWSFAVEAQAIDRVHRMGQSNEVIVKRFVVRGSIEEKMLKIQERKKFIASSLGMMSDEEKKVQRIEDIKELLS
ncbi:SNF2 family N-terminal domain-containing protein [Macrophomina phaseolina]|uniref:SNF2 family N-terminal domain-containing protein n=1 Tax=Macrophomina phaseolina TaxID=35725 RepID=A0ABQ8GT03_9PEZI|nr:SNF2 family N-terminal domain-containing protein [Macrophomina phaseolina]